MNTWRVFAYLDVVGADAKRATYSMGFSLPFAPFPGLILLIDGVDLAPIRTVRYDPASEEFGVAMHENRSHSLPLAEHLEIVREELEALGWSVHEGVTPQ